jgi:hypothetical protein
MKVNELQIVDISDSAKKSSTLINTEKIAVDYQTGEVVYKEALKVTKEKNKEKFIKIFIDNLDYIIEALKPIEKSIFFVLMHQMNYHNVVILNSTTRKTTQKALNLSQSAVSKGINALIDKKVLIKIEETKAKEFNVPYFTDKEYLVNPQLIGSGSFKDLSRIRHIVTTTYDFNKLETTKEIEASYVYSEFDEVSKDLENHEVKQITRQISSDEKNTSTEILLGEKNSNDVIDIETSAAIANSEKSDLEQQNENLEIELRIKEAENESKRLDIEYKRLENAKLDKEIELMKLKKSEE